MDNQTLYQEAYDKIAPLVDSYIDEHYPDGLTIDPSDPDTVTALVEKIRCEIITRYPEINNIAQSADDEVNVAFFGCGCVVWLIIGAIIGRACTKCRCGRPCQCSRCGCCKKCCRCGC